MKNNVERWESMGLLANTPNKRKEFVANSLESLISYLNKGSLETMIFLIIVRIGNEIDFGFNDFSSIVDEVYVGLKKIKHNENSNLDEELNFCESYSNNKIKELKETKKNTKENEK